MAESVRWAIGTGGEAPTILLPGGCAEPGARRHAREHAAETGREVQVYRRTEGGDGWERHGDPAHPPIPGYLDVWHFHPCNAARCAAIAVPEVLLVDVLRALRDRQAWDTWISEHWEPGWPADVRHEQADIAARYLADRFGAGRGDAPCSS